VETNGMALAQRLDVEKSKDFVGLEQLERRNIAYALLARTNQGSGILQTFDDFAKDTGCHG